MSVWEEWPFQQRIVRPVAKPLQSTSWSIKPIWTRLKNLHEEESGNVWAGRHSD